MARTHLALALGAGLSGEAAKQGEAEGAALPRLLAATEACGVPEGAASQGCCGDRGWDRGSHLTRGLVATEAGTEGAAPLSLRRAAPEACHTTAKP